MVCGLVILANTIGALIQTKEKHNANILLNANFMTTKTEAVKIYKTYMPPHNWTKYVISNSFVLFVPNTVELREEFDSYTQAAKDTYWYGYEINLNDVVFQQKGLEAVLISFDKSVKHDLDECNLYHSFCGFSKEFVIDGQPSEVFQP